MIRPVQSVRQDVAERISGFPPILGEDPVILILGSMPSVASLEKHQYYGQTRNAFWRIMGELFAAGPELTYPERTARLAQAGIAVWDVLAACVRPGSLDSAIVAGSESANDIRSLLLQFPGIRHIFFNGRKAEQLFRQQVLLTLGGEWVGQSRYTVLPSTSPAMAALDFAGKLQRWQVVQDVLGSAMRDADKQAGER